MSWGYSVKNGWVLHNGIIAGVGYSGHGSGLDNPAQDCRAGVGPIPAGVWQIGTFFDHPHLGPIVSHLAPTQGTDTFGRTGFFIHGDNVKCNHSASHGCIILPRSLREKIRDSKDHVLIVV